MFSIRKLIIFLVSKYKDKFINGGGAGMGKEGGCPGEEKNPSVS